VVRGSAEHLGGCVDLFGGHRRHLGDSGSPSLDSFGVQSCLFGGVALR
jgi:hypothetical protein